MRTRTATLLACALLIGATLLAYGRVVHWDFVNIDDPAYVIDNENVRAGLTWDGVLWAFTTAYRSNWHPLTWISLMLDAEIGGLDPRVFHATNLILHIVNALLLFFALRGLTRALWRSAFVAALFALHPLHVESVAWVSERKDVLSTAFWFLALAAYARFAARPRPGRYALVALAFVLGLLSKPMLVTLPLVLLLLDYWPLRRLGDPGAPEASRAPSDAGEDARTAAALETPLPVVGPSFLRRGSRSRACLLEKAPLLALSALASAVTLYAQSQGGALRSLEQYPILLRAENALVSCGAYLVDAIWPAGLAVFYPHPRAARPASIVILSALALAVLSALAIRLGWRRPYLAVGWLWYLLTLLPVIGLVQVGNQARADRYTYVPLVGIFLAAVWGAADLRGSWVRASSGASSNRPRSSGAGTRSSAAVRSARHPPGGSEQRSAGVLARIAAVVLGGATLAACLILTYVQVGYWRDSIALFEHALEVTSGQAFAHNNLGIALARKGAEAEAAAHWREAVRIDPGYADALANLCGALLQEGRNEEAAASCRRSLAIQPENPGARTYLGLALMRRGNLREATDQFLESLRLRPRNASTRNNLGIALFRQGRADDAVQQFTEALKLQPDHLDARVNLGTVLAAQGRLEEAIAQFSEALRIDPRSPRAREGLAEARARLLAPAGAGPPPAPHS